MSETLESLLDRSPSAFLSAAADLRLTNPLKSTLKTLIHALPPSSPLASSLPSALLEAVSRALEAFGDGGGSPREPPAKRGKRDSPDQWERLRLFAFVAQVCVSHPEKCFAAEAIFPAVRLLHDSLLLFEKDPVLLSAVAGLCEEWWKEALPEKENLISQTLPYLLARSLEHGKKSDVRRISVLREAFALFDFVDESSVDLRRLLLRCVCAPLYLKVEEGRRFISYVMGLNDQLMREAFALMKVQIPFGRKSVLEAYADILFRTWKILDGSLKEEFEDDFLQGLIDAAIHARSNLLESSIRRVLGGFFVQRATEGVDKLLLRIAQPLLFRSLQVANSNVRLNALCLVIDMFPLEDPDATRDVKEVLLEKQFCLLDKLLVDDCPNIRAISVEGACRILNMFWEIIPSPIITRLLTKIVDDISFDPCSEVRLSVVNGLIYLLGNPQSHEVLKVILPRLGAMFLDSVLSVRIAVSDLLLAIRDIRTFQYNKVVALDDLLSSLGNDHPHVAQKITRLLMPSYFPSQKMINEACSRCVVLIKRFPKAGARFCEFAFKEGSSIKSLIELVKSFITLILTSKDLTTEQLNGLFSACANLCDSLSSDESVKKAVSASIPEERFKCLLNAAVTLQSQTSFLRIASIISPVNMSGFREHCLCLIIDCRDLPHNFDMQTEIRTAHKLMISCGWSNNLVEVLTGILQVVASKFHENFVSQLPRCGLPSWKNKKTRLPKKVLVELDRVTKKISAISGTSNFEVGYPLASAAAWQLKDLLLSSSLENPVSTSSLTPAFSALRILSQACMEQCKNQRNLDSSPVLAYVTIALHCRSNSETFIICDTSNHLVKCMINVFSEMDSATARSSLSKSRPKRKATCKDSNVASASERDNALDDSKTRDLSHVVKLATAVLKFMMDAATTEITSVDGPSSLHFAATYASYVKSILEGHQNHKFSLNDEAFACLRGSFTYAAKLLHLVLSSVKTLPAPSEASYLVNCLLDLVASVEIHLGSRYALRIFSVAKSWVCDLILGLCSVNLSQPSMLGTTSETDSHIPVWLTTLSKLELYEASDLDEQKQRDGAAEKDFSVFKKLRDLITQLLNKGSVEILGAVGVSILSPLKVGFRKRDFDIVFGLTHFVCVKLLGDGRSKGEALRIMDKSLQEAHVLIERAISDKTVAKNEKLKLESARNLLKRVISDV